MIFGSEAHGVSLDFDTFNKEYNRNLVVNDNQYWVCNGDKEGCVQTIIYPKDMKVSLKQYK